MSMLEEVSPSNHDVCLLFVLWSQDSESPFMCLKEHVGKNRKRTEWIAQGPQIQELTGIHNILGWRSLMPLCSLTAGFGLVEAKVRRSIPGSGQPGQVQQFVAAFWQRNEPRSRPRFIPPGHGIQSTEHILMHSMHDIT